MIFTTLLAAAAPALASGGNTGVSLMVHAEYLHVGPGEIVRNALVQVDEGQIVAVLPGRSAPDGALSVHSAHAGMIDASALPVSNWVVEIGVARRGSKLRVAFSPTML